MYIKKIHLGGYDFMRKNRIVILAGNGITVDLIKYLNLDIDPSSPLQSFNSPNIDLTDFISRLESINKDLLPLTQSNSDFEAMNQFLDFGNWEYNNNSKKESDLRRFLALSYSKLQLEIDKNSLLNWSWTKWMKKHRKNIVGFISFNYDVVLEKAFRQADPKRGYFRWERIKTQKEFHFSNHMVL